MSERLTPHSGNRPEKTSAPLSKIEEEAMTEREVEVRALLMRLAHFSDDLELIVGQTYIVRGGEYHTRLNKGTLIEGIITVKELREGLAEGLREYDLSKRQKVRVQIEEGSIVPFAADAMYYIEPNLDHLKEKIPAYNDQEDFIEQYVADYKKDRQEGEGKDVPKPFTRH